MKLIELRRRLRFLLDIAGSAYADYRSAGQRFCDAKRLYEVNTRIEELLLEHGGALPPQNWRDAAALLRHLQIWRLSWEETRARTNPTGEDVFAFANTVTFPRTAVAALCAETNPLAERSFCVPNQTSESSAVKTLIIAEAGVNHDGDIDMALRLIDAAAEAGADLVKFQTFKADALASVNAPKAEYQVRNENASASDSQAEMLRRLELPHAAHETLMNHCAARGIGFFSTGFDLESLDYLKSLGFKQFKVPSGEITNLPYLRKIAGFGCDLILSTGMSTLGEIESALEAIELAGLPRNRITVLHCTTEYPAPIDEVNLRAMTSIGHALGVSVGYSDHTEGVEVPIAAVALGATVIEKHFTLDRTLPGPDHAASLEPSELAAMVQGIRKIEAALGSGQKRRTPSEARNMAVARKSIVAAQAIAKGDIFNERNLTVKRPGTGLSPMRWDEVLGRRAARDFTPDEEIEL
jgi:N,N'-diacetyllegionaminate synthase